MFKPIVGPAASLAVMALLATPVPAKTLTIGLDVSASNPLVSSDTYARSAALFVRDKVAALQAGDTVVIRTFGDRSLANFPAERLTISRQSRADKIGGRVAQYIAGMPSKKLDGQDSTNIIGFFTFGQFDCPQGGEVILLTDGIESSNVFSADSLLAGKPLPRPEKGLLSGCAVTMYGIGQSRVGEWSPKQIQHIRASWTAWMAVAGAHYTAIIDP